jgi:hypothetical protein
MKEHTVDPYSKHKEVFLLLPWYVNRSLREPEMREVESHLKVCLNCKREMANQLRLATAVNAADALDSSAQASFSRLMNQIHTTESATRSGASFHPSRKWYHRLDINFFRMPQAAMVLVPVLALMLLAPGYFFSRQMENTTYRTLSDGESAVGSTRDIQVIFAKGSSLQQIEFVLQGIDGQIVEGPSPEGLYLIRLPSSEKNFVEALLTLRSNSIVVFAEPTSSWLTSVQSETGFSQ